MPSNHSGKTYIVRFSGILPPDGGMERVRKAAEKLGYRIEEISEAFRFNLPDVFKEHPETPIHKMYPEVSLAQVVTHYAENLSAVLGRPLEGSTGELVDLINATEVRMRGLRVFPVFTAVEITPIDFVFIEDAAGTCRGRITLVKTGTVEETFYVPDSEELRFQDTRVTVQVSRGRYATGFDHIEIDRKANTRLVRIRPDVPTVEQGTYLGFARELSVEIASPDKQAARLALRYVRSLIEGIQGLKIMESGVFKLTNRFGNGFLSRFVPASVLLCTGALLWGLGIFLDKTVGPKWDMTPVFVFLGAFIVTLLAVVMYVNSCFAERKKSENTRPDAGADGSDTVKDVS